MKAPEAKPFSPAHPELPRQLSPRVGYVENAFEVTCLREALRRRQGTQLADFFSILLRPFDDFDIRSRNHSNLPVRESHFQHTRVAFRGNFLQIGGQC